MVHFFFLTYTCRRGTEERREKREDRQLQPQEPRRERERERDREKERERESYKNDNNQMQIGQPHPYYYKEKPTQYPRRDEPVEVFYSSFFYFIGFFLSLYCY